jgi:YHS domain-containing protein
LPICALKKLRKLTFVKTEIMYRYILTAALAITLASCGNSTEQPKENEMEAAATSDAPHADNSAAIKSGKMDPVCEMDYDGEWTENTVYMNDTIRFCSEGCKTAFLARPAKYIKAEQ